MNQLWCRVHGNQQVIYTQTPKLQPIAESAEYIDGAENPPEKIWRHALAAELNLNIRRRIFYSLAESHSRALATIIVIKS